MKNIFLKYSVYLSIILIINACNSVDPIEKVEVRRSGFCLTFDDDYLAEWVNINDMLESNNVKATFFIARDYLSSTEKAFLNTLLIHGHEIGCHTLHHCHSLEFISNHSIREYLDTEIIPQIEMMNGLGIYPKSFSYPYGENDSTLDKELLKYFEILRDVTDEQKKPLEKPIEEIDEIFYKNINPKIVVGLDIDNNFNISLEQIEKVFKRAKDNNEIVIFYAHQPVNEITRSYQISIDYLQKLFLLAKKYELKNYTLSELINK